MNKIKLFSLSVVVSILLVGCGDKSNSEIKDTNVIEEPKEIQSVPIKEIKTVEVKNDINTIKVVEHIDEKKEIAKVKEIKVISGETLYGKCKSCHGANGDKKGLGKSAIINTLSSEEIKISLSGYKAGTLNKYGMGGIMKGQVASYSSEELETLSKYITTLK